VYCNKNIFHAAYRARSVENVVADMQEQIERSGVRQIDIVDDNLFADRAYAHELFDGIIRRRFNLYLNLQNGVRADALTEDLVKKMKRAGVFKVSMGVESGDPVIQNKIGKSLNLDDVIASARLLKRYGIAVYGNFMLGLPGDTPESMQRTIDFAGKMDPDIANFMITIPFPGTALYELAHRQGTLYEDLKKGAPHGFYGGYVYYTLPGMDRRSVAGYYKKSYRAFYFRPQKILEIMRSVRSLSELRWASDAAVEVMKSLFVSH